jgi:hypothetical protein
MKTIRKIFDSFDNRGMIFLNKFMEMKFSVDYVELDWDWEQVVYSEIEQYECLEDAPYWMKTEVEKEYTCYFRYENNEKELKVKILSWLSRPAHKEGTKESREWLLDGINAYLGTSFSEQDIGLIYAKLGNNVNRRLCDNFIESNYDMNVLKKE